MRVAPQVTLSPEERTALERQSRIRRSTHGPGVRARIVLLAAEGRSNLEIASRLGISRLTAARWRQRFLIYRSRGLEGPAVRQPRSGGVSEEKIRAILRSTAKSIVDQMKERNIPAYIADDYYAIAWPTTLRTFKNNLETIHQYSDTGFNLIMNGEIGRYENTRYIEQTNIPHGTGTDGLTTIPWTVGVSDWIFFFGNDTVAEAVAVPEEMRGKIPTDYGRSKGIAWYYLGGFGLAHTIPINVRVVKWDSAA